MTIINAAAFTQLLVNSSDYFARSQPAIGYRCAVATATLVRVPKRKAPPSMVDAPQRLPRHQRLRRYLTHHDYLQGCLFSRIRCYKMCSRLHELYKGIRKQWLMGLNTLGLVAICPTGLWVVATSMLQETFLGHRRHQAEDRRC